MAANKTPLGRWLSSTGADRKSVAKAAGLAPSTLRRIAQGHIIPSWQKAKALIKATHGALSYEDFFGDPLADATA